MRDILIFLSGSLFTVFLLSGSVFFAFKVTEYREDSQSRKELRRKRAASASQDDRGGVIRPKTYKERQFEKDESSQAFLEMLDSTDKI